ncbi:MAG: hypothetical protein GWP61_08875 [Chloroflexi bacterium]|jgi:hypothetical protein|nr:hypothetical protein [Chloroflexota bacterium]
MRENNSDSEFDKVPVGTIFQFVAWILILACLFFVVIIAVFDSAIVRGTWQALSILLQIGEPFIQIVLLFAIASFLIMVLGAYLQRRLIGGLQNSLARERKKIAESHKMVDVYKQRVQKLTFELEEEKKRSKFVRPDKTKATELTLTTLQTGSAGKLTPRYLFNVVAPYLVAIEELRHSMDNLYGESTADVQIFSLSQYTPISVNLSGIVDAFKTIQGMVSEWRLKQNKTLEKLREEKLELENEELKARVMERHALAAKTHEETRLLAAQKELVYREIQKSSLESEQMKFELAIARQPLIDKIAKQVGKGLPEDRVSAFKGEISGPIEELTKSELNANIRPAGPN